MASDLQKPDGFVIIPEGRIHEILDPLAVSKIWGIGKVTAKKLETMGIYTVEQLRTAPRYQLKMVFGNQTDEILNLAQGIDNRAVQPHTQAKSISAEETFDTDIRDPDVLVATLIHQIEEVSQRLRADKLQCRTLTLKFRYGDFKTITRSFSMEKPTQTTKILLQEATKLFNQWYKSSAGALRLLGFGVSGLSPQGSGQKLLFDEPEDEKQKQLDSAFDKIREKYGDHSVRRGL